MPFLSNSFLSELEMGSAMGLEMGSAMALEMGLEMGLGSESALESGSHLCRSE